MPIESADYLALLARCKAAIDEGRNPIATLTGEEQETLQRLHNEDVAGAATLLIRLRDYAEHNPDESRRWSRRDSMRLSFAPYAEAARVLRDDIERAERNASNVVSMATRRVQTNARPRGALAELNPAVMVTMASAKLRAVGLLRLRRDGRLWFDGYANQFKTNWRGDDDGATIAERNMDDAFYLSVALWFAQQDEKLGALSLRVTIECCHTAAGLDQRNAPRDWLNGLAWDGVERLRDVLRFGFGAAESEFNVAVGRCWFVGMVARVFRPGCQLDTMPVLIGPQGIGKSQALRVIGGDWYRAAMSPIHSKDFNMELWGAMVFEIPELHSLVTSNAAAAKVKAVISNQVDHFRRAYGYAIGEFKRTACMVGTTNNRDWHHDESGARRFWPIHCGDVDLVWLAANRCQLFAEARAYFEMGTDDERGQWWTVPALAQRELMEHETGESIWRTVIEQRLSEAGLYRRASDAPVPWDGTLSETTDWGNTVTTARIAWQWLKLNSTEAGKRKTANDIGSIMRRLGWQRVQKRMPGSEIRAWIWLPPESDGDNAPEVIPDASQGDPDDIPF